jgi:hypothetical protein
MARHANAKFSRGRQPPTRTTRKTHLIVCEGAVTETYYFKAFRKGVRVEEIKVEGTGTNTISLVREATKLRNKYAEYDEVWCVFDKDSFTPEQFNTAIQMALSNKMKAAYSNEAFELWYLLHFEYCESGLNRNTYKERLTKYLGKEYKKNDPKMYETLLPNQATAISNAKRLAQMHTSNSPADHNPVTLVYQLVESLNNSQ